MPALIHLSVKEANDLADEIEKNGGNADSIRAAVNDVANPRNGRTSIPATSTTEEEYLEDMRRKSAIETGTDLECMICHDKFDHLLSGTCEVCWREWMLGIMPKGR